MLELAPGGGSLVGRLGAEGSPEGGGSAGFVQAGLVGEHGGPLLPPTDRMGWSPSQSLGSAAL